MFGVSRGGSKNDRVKYPVDKQSLNEFIDKINPFESRYKMLQEWIDKKERENKEAPITDAILDAGHKFIKKDSVFQKVYEARLQKKINRIVESLFETKYADIKREDLHLFVENLIERLYLLKRHMPKNLKYVIKGILQHKNLAALDKSNLLTALKWQEITLDVDDSPLVAVNKVEIEGEKIAYDEKLGVQEGFRRRLQVAGLPIVEHLATKLESFYSK